MSARPLIVGLGSRHGDDQAGWLVIERLHARGVLPERARAAATPAELWDWCSADRQLTLCDASFGSENVGVVRRWTWPGVLFTSRRRGTHDLPLAEVLALGVELGCCPRQVTIWTIAGERFEPGAEPSPVVRAAADELAEQLWGELQRA